MNLPLAIPSPDISYFDIGPLRIHFYALLMIAAIIVAAAITARRLRRSGTNPDTVLDIALWAVPIGIIGGRLYHVATHPADYFFAGADLWRVLYVWEGGLAIFGSITFGALGVWIGARRAGVSFITVADALAPGLLVAQAVGRIGNYFNQELFGAPTTLPWGLEIDQSSPAFPPGLPSETLFHPLFLYEMLWNLTGVAVILLVERLARRREGFAIGTYLIWYGAGRAWFESFRLDPTELELLGVKINIITAGTVAVLGVIIIAAYAHRTLARSDSAPRSPGSGREADRISR
ncbi:prolipoprotein diacylglyceryl transferase [Mycetocola manganoxydans]|uniref:Phosphatidylglycerol--prolipoprotein diacylglyceryl transferase n=1 Tax=Mycetocola manganoxydans TaxID=699879 RepID=A0A3L6ZU92_9MICO|nr:prolipoprotein diacylglyceryl transferase [Mycetocola manganoxydans]RLP71379.1 prolipoprotein diacylglyceryl transferase [Mycetocola manganoxydans]GHD46121.1 prolipoprotein diacylglyceryl transferase [Mycetocola manganoxydans]